MLRGVCRPVVRGMPLSLKGLFRPFASTHVQCPLCSWCIYIAVSLFTNHFFFVVSDSPLKSPKAYIPMPCTSFTTHVRATIQLVFSPPVVRRWCLAWESFRDDTSKQRPSWRPRRRREPRNVLQNLPRVKSVAGGGCGENKRGG